MQGCVHATACLICRSLISWQTQELMFPTYYRNNKIINSHTFQKNVSPWPCYWPISFYSYAASNSQGLEIFRAYFYYSHGNFYQISIKSELVAMGTLRMLADMSSSDNSFLSLNSFPCVSSSPLFCQSPAFILKYFRNFASLFYVCYLVVKTQSNLAVEFKTQFSIFFISITYASLQLSKLYSQYLIH